MALGLGLGIQYDNKVSSEAAFSLTDIAGLQLWAKNKTGVTTGDTLTWADQSGNGNDITQSTLNAQPIYDPADGSFDFSGSNNASPIYMDFKTGLSLGAFTAFYVLQFSVSATNEFYGINQLDSDANNNIVQLFGNNSAMFGYVYGGAGASDRVNALPLTNNRPTSTKFVLTIRKDLSVGATISFKNNQSTMASSTTFSSSATVDIDRIGYRLTGGRSLEGRCFETAYYNASLSAQDVTNVVNDLMTRNSI